MLDRTAISDRFRRVRAQTEAIVRPLSDEDMLVQSMPDASPAKWHLAHTTWFFEEFVLARFVAGHRWIDPAWRILFNSYYGSVGPSHPRSARGALSRPSLGAIRAWRARIDEEIIGLLPSADSSVLRVVVLGTHHEQQHQELILTDVKHAFSLNPLLPAYAESRTARSSDAVPEVAIDASRRAAHSTHREWFDYEEGLALVGHEDETFSFDNEQPAHRVAMGPFQLASGLVTNGQYAAFIDDGGYARPDLWLSAGFSETQRQGWTAPLYWQRPSSGGDWLAFTMDGLGPIDREAPVAHVSFYEADAYARWAGARLPTEHEWEWVAKSVPVQGNFVESGCLSPVAATSSSRPRPLQLFGDAWEWTASAYLPYPRFKPLPGSLGEYNGKFMSGQMILRGGSCFSPQSHLRPTYRNYFPPETRWQMSGLRLARDA